MEVVIAPDKFRGTLSAADAAEAIGRGVRAVFPTASLILRPMADGGEGTLEALLTALGGRSSTVEVTGPLGDPVNASVAWLADGTAAIESAQAVGLMLLEDRRDALRADSTGVGELIGHVLDSDRASSLIVAMGGTASSDGGTGAARALGYRFLDARGEELPPGGGHLRELARIDPDGADPRLRDLEIRGAADVDNALLGERGAARVFGPTKGASPNEIEILEEGLTVLADRISADLGVDVAERPSAGAAGGMGAGLMAFCGAEITGGFDLIAGAAGLADSIRWADIVITGEGRLDEQTLGGKTAAGVARLANEHGVRCLAVAGEVPIPPADVARAGFKGAISLIEVAGKKRALEDTAGALTAATKKILGSKVVKDVPGRRDRLSM